MNRDVCEHFNPVDLPCDKCKPANVQKSTLREAAQAVLDRWDSPAWEWLKQGPTAALMADLRAALAEPVQEPVACEPQYANDDGWCEWVCPNPAGYLMQCCDCGLIHEVDSRVAKYQPRPSEEFEVVDDPDLQVQWRMKRRDDISPKRKPLTEDEIALIVADCSASAHRQDDFHFARAIERAHGIGDSDE